MRWIGFLVAGLLLAGCSQEKTSSPPPERVVPVLVAKVVEQDVPVYIYSVGNLLAWNETSIKPQVSGMLQEIHFKDGQKVSKGDLLFTIDPRPFQAVVDKAKATLLKDKASLELAEATLKRYSSLVKSDYVSKLNYDTYKTNVETQKAQMLTDQADLDTAEINLGYTSIKASQDGIMSEHTIDPGNLVTAEQTVLSTIVQVDPLQVRFSISQRDYLLFRSVKPQPKIVEISLPSDNNTPYPGKVFFVDNKLSPTTGTLALKAKVPNPNQKLWPGEFVKVKLQLKTIEKAKVMPLAALQYGQNGPYIYVVKKDMTVEARPIDIATKNEIYVATATGFSAGETVVIDGQINLSPGAKVAIKDKSLKEAK